MSFERDPFVTEPSGKAERLRRTLQLDRNGHRPVLPAGAANGDRDITPVVCRHHGKPLGQKPLDVQVHPDDFRLLFKKPGDRFIATRQRLEVRVVMRIGKHAYVKHIVGVAGDAALERKGFEDQSELVAAR